MNKRRPIAEATITSLKRRRKLVSHHDPQQQSLSLSTQICCSANRQQQWSYSHSSHSLSNNKAHQKRRMERHIQVFLNRISFASMAIATLTLLILFLQTPETCFVHDDPNIILKPHQKFPKSSCEASHRSLTSIGKKNRRLWSSKAWKNAVASFASLFQNLRTSGHLNNNSHVLCVSAGAGHPVMALNEMGISEVTGVELVDSPPLVSQADPHNLPFFDSVFDLGFSGFFDRALFPDRYAAEMERTVRVGGACAVAVEECGNGEVMEIVNLFRKSRLVNAKNVTLTGSKMTIIIMKVTVPP